MHKHEVLKILQSSKMSLEEEEEKIFKLSLKENRHVFYPFLFFKERGIDLQYISSKNIKNIIQGTNNLSMAQEYKDER